MSDRRREPGWYRIPDGSTPRYWDGFRWTDRKWGTRGWQLVFAVGTVIAVLWFLYLFLRVGFGMVSG